MPTHFDLIITADYPNRTAELRLLDQHGSQLAFRQTDFKNIEFSRQRGLFDLRNYLRNYVEPGHEAASVAEIGVCIAEQVLGEEIFRKLWESESQRTLRIQLPGATEEKNHLAAELACVPWEFARPALDQPTLIDRNLLVRVVHDLQASATQSLELGPDGCLRVLFVFAETRGSQPLAARQEWRELGQLFKKEIYPQRRIVADFLTHGVTRELLKSQIIEHGGYHIVHWSGHGHLNLLELTKPGGASDRLSGDELLDLFTSSGGFIPRLFFLSACHSGDPRVKDWSDVLAIAQGREPGTKQTPNSETKQISLDEQPGYTGTAHALLQGGVSSIVAMRYAVGDDYARELGVEFYRALLAHAEPKNVAAALTIARQALLDPQKHCIARYSACDHATPVLYGAEQPDLTLQQGRSPGLDTRNRRLHQITELTTAGHEHIVGRTWELAALGADFIGSSHGSEVKPVAVITGLGGMGKTALTAESLALWESRFEWVLLYQAKPNTLGFEATLSDIHFKLNAEWGLYHNHVKARPADAIYHDATAEFTGPERMERLTRNLVGAMRNESILLVLDNFETNLKPPPSKPDAQAKDPSEIADSFACASGLNVCLDPAWDRCLALLATELIGTPSRVLITCRRPLAALPESVALCVRLGPLPPGEAALYLRKHEGLSKLLFSDDEGEKALAMRLLSASRFHPLLMDRLARLSVGGESLRRQLLQVLVTLENSPDYSQLPDLFATDPGDARELAYLNDALATSLDQLIHEASPDARRLLWMIAVANEPAALNILKPAALSMLKKVWSGVSQGQEDLQQLKQMLNEVPSLPPKYQAEITAMPPWLRIVLEAVPPVVAVRPDLTPSLRYLVEVGLATEERTASDDANPELTCHELVRERIRAWMQEHDQDRADLTENSLRVAYAERLEAMFKALQHQNMTAALAAGSRAVIYFIQAGAYGRIGKIASSVITSTNDPVLLASLIPHLQVAAESASEGRDRWCCLGNVADALGRGGHPDASLIFYERAAAEARAGAEPDTKKSRQHWHDLAWITWNWAATLTSLGNLEAARQRRIESDVAAKKAGYPRIYFLGHELEALSNDIKQGRAIVALPMVEARIAQLEVWWQQHRSGQAVPEAPDQEILARTLISALDIALHAHFGQRDWKRALSRTEVMLNVQRTLHWPAEVIAKTRVSRANVLIHLGRGRFREAQDELEACRDILKNHPGYTARVLSSFANLFHEQGDIQQAIIQQRRALAHSEQLRDPSYCGCLHNNLANYLECSGTSAVRAESSRHRLAALLYHLVIGLEQNLETMRRRYAGLFRGVEAAPVLNVPRVAELLVDPIFHSLAAWLDQRQLRAADLQITVDQFIDQARHAVLNQP